MLRLHAGCHPQDTRLARIVNDLSAAPDFRRLWAEQDVYRPTYGAKVYRHPTVGELTLGFAVYSAS
ncbi:hypothetical protein [Streptomyces colonosanans]|uniref:MmyB-like transcription regulator ligand binding domain-containing protein n=1 Tax=Streptomyces colonosanans TaxID=1428652 RepID=A0A1S2PP84_9ACTN|nr:hypothetical protein [Streptomyces colonosanans]OIJ95619.1 hypothetical protein BIV24_08415 [Streptomyces colonosanans]